MKTVWITGASRGIGGATALRFAREGYNVVVQYNRSELQAELLATTLKGLGVGAIALHGDVSRKQEVLAVYDTAKINFKKIDVLVNCAGISSEQLFQNVSEKDVKEIVDVNLLGSFYACQAVAPDMIDRQAGAIVNVSSMWGLTGASMEVAYSMSKAGVIGLTKALAKELAPSNITVNCIAPGAVMTDMMAHFPEETLSLVAQETPLGRIGNAEEMADAIYFLATQPYITGQVLSVDGGMVI